MENRWKIWGDAGSARGRSSGSVSGKRIKRVFLGSDFHMPELCNQTNICGSPPAPQSRHGSLQRNVPAYQSPCWPQTALQLTLAIRNSAFPPGNPQCHLHPLFLGRCCSHPTPPCPGLHWGASWGGGAGCRHWLGAPWTQWGGRGGRAALPLVHVTSQSAGGPGWGGGWRAQPDACALPTASAAV